MPSIFRKTKKPFFHLLSPKLQKIVIKFKGAKRPFYLYNSLRQFNYSINRLSNIQTYHYDWDVWKKTFKKFILSQPDSIDIVKSFFTSVIKPIKMRTQNNKEDLILICVVKNDLERLKMFYEHYRKIGVNHFVIVDNNSDDGTREWLLQQTDSDIYLATDKFQSKRKYGWINKILSIYGFNRWYLYADSDELLVFNDIENHRIQDLIKYANDKNEKRVTTVMLDMYSDKSLFRQKSQKNIIDEYIYFDTNTYSISRNYKGLAIKGGPRKRVLKDDENWSGPLLIKHPLFYFEEGDVFESAHYIFPFEKESFPVGALLHYKFIETDLERYKKIARDENFSNGSMEYKQYIKSYENNNHLTFMYEGSEKYIDSSSLKNIPFIEKIRWNEIDYKLRE